MENKSIGDTQEEELSILIDWPSQGGGVQKVSRGDAIKAIQEKSKYAIKTAMSSIRGMAYTFSKTMDAFEDKVKPDEAEVEFGINLDAEIGALLTKASTEAHLTVKFKWTLQKPEKIEVQLNE